jgi:hypothetical protein
MRSGLQCSKDATALSGIKRRATKAVVHSPSNRVTCEQIFDLPRRLAVLEKKY